MRNIKQGFTLIELVVVVLIMGILASIALPYYFKTIEVSKAGNAVGIGHLLANAHRMYNVDHTGVWLAGEISNACMPLPACITTPTNGSSACQLLACSYVKSQDWDGGAYRYFLGSNPVATLSRRTGPNPGTDVSPYTGWGYSFSNAGFCTPVGIGVPSCPGF